jgi:2-methylisocitrate lyase-like PEP mutase family enzyme
MTRDLMLDRRPAKPFAHGAKRRRHYRTSPERKQPMTSETLRSIIDGDSAVVAPGAFTPLMAQQAKAAGFRALYLSGGAIGWLPGVTEANVTLNDMISVGVDIRAVSDLPLILDAAGGWNDPMHLHRTIALAERAGFGGVEIEDQILPKRAHHHIDRNYLIPSDAMEAKIREAVSARKDDDFVIIARTDAHQLSCE